MGARMDETDPCFACDGDCDVCVLDGIGLLPWPVGVGSSSSPADLCESAKVTGG